MRKPTSLLVRAASRASRLFLLTSLWVFLLASLNPSPVSADPCLNCDNATDGGLIAGDETGCPDPVFDPGLITNVQLPSGGSGDLEYLWIYTTVDPNLPVTNWIPLPGSDAPEYDPDPITQTTWYRRCARRSGCTDYIAESNYIVKEVDCCDNVTDPGEIGSDQKSCGLPYSPDLLQELVSASGGSGMLSYTWYQSTSGPPFDPLTWTEIPGAEDASYQPGDLSVSTWFVRVAQRENCADGLPSNAVLIEVHPGLEAIIASTNPSCDGDTNGSIDLSVTGGTPPLTYLWNTGDTTEDLVDQGAGNYSVTVTDAVGCSVISSVELVAPPALALTLLFSDPTCAGEANGVIDLTADGGTQPLTFTWSTGDMTEDLSGLTAGVYSVTVSDANGCSGTADITLQEPDPLTVTGTVVPVQCAGDANGAITTNVVGGTPDFLYAWSNGATTSNLTDIPAGSYTVTVTDANGCTAENSWTLNDPPELSLNGDVTDVDCAGEQTGVITTTVSGGTPGFTYLWSNGSSTPDLVQVPAGSYSLTVTDAANCTISSTFEISEPDFLELAIDVTPISCTGEADGELSASVTGGTPGYTYQWDDPAGSTTSSIDGLLPGTYTVTVTDAVGCSVIGSAELVEAPNSCGVNIGDFVWLDSDRDGRQDANEYGENGIPVRLVQPGPDGIYGTPDDDVIMETETAGFGLNTGYYLFTDVPEGTYAICFFIDTANFQFTLQDAAFDDELDSDADPNTGCTDPFTITASSEDDLSFDAGIHVRCENVDNGGMIGYDEILCAPGGDPDEIINLVLPTGGVGQLEYLWLYSDSDPNYYPGNPNWLPVPNSNSPSYDPPPISTSTYYIRCARREGCLDYPGETNIISKEVIDPIADIANAPNDPLCVDESYLFGAASSGPGAEYAWDFGADALPQTANTILVPSVRWTSPGLKTVILSVTLEGCTNTTTLQLEVEDCGNMPGIHSLQAVVNADYQVTLTWQADELDFDHVFLVERSTDGQTFSYLMTQPGEVHQEMSYELLDETPGWGINSYRVRLVGMKGQEGLSQPVEVLVRKPDMFNVSIFPNPFSDQLTVRCLEPLSEDGHILFYDVSGRMIDSNVFPAGSREVQFATEDWPVGQLHARIVQPGKRPYSILIFRQK